MKDLAQYKAPRNEGWFADPNAYWYEAVFGPQAISPDIDSRLKELHDAGATPIEAIKALHLDYSFGLAEAKRRLSLSKHWQSEARAADVLHAHVLAVLERGAKPKRRRAA